MLIGVFYIRLLFSKPDPPSTVSTPGLSSAYCTRLDDVCFNLRAVSLFPLPGWFVGPKYDTMSLSGDERSGFYAERLETGA